jgi:hypothetical protein
VTGKNVLKGLLEQYTWLVPLVILGVVFSLVWPAWISVSGNMLAYLLGLNPQYYGASLSTILLIFMLCIWFFKQAYSIIESISRFGLLLLLSIVLVIFATLISWQQIISSVGTSYIPTSPNDKVLFLSALAFGGVAGVLNLVQSDWVTKRQYGATALNRDVDWASSKTRKNWHAWWRMVSLEHGILFYGGNSIGIGLIALVAVLTVGGKAFSGFSLLTYQVQYLNEKFIVLGTLWGIGIILLFFMAQMTILDAAGRLLHKCLDTVSVVKNNTLTSERTSQIVGIAGLGILIVGIFIPGLNQPAGLLQISASLSAIIFAVYPLLLIRLNSTLPDITKPTKKRIVLVVLSCIFYAAVSVWTFL